MKKKLIFMLVAIAAMVSCSEDNDDNPKVVLSKETQTEQTLYADQTTGTDGGIKFHAVGSWNATVSEVTQRSPNNAPGWLTLSAYSGSAGSNTITLSLRANYTGVARQAKIDIICGSTTATVYVKQEATTQEGDIPVFKKTVKRITKEPGEANPESLLFYYDTDGRIARITSSEEGYNSSSTFIHLGNKITENDGEGTIVHTIGDNGYIESSVTTVGYYEEVNKFGYSNGYINDISSRYIDDDGKWANETVNFALSSGKIVSSVTQLQNNENIISTVYGYQSNSYDCISNLNISHLLIEGPNELFLLNYFGKDTLYLINRITTTGDQENKDNGVHEIRYEKDKDGYVVKIYGRWTPENGPTNPEALLYEIEYYDK